MIKAKNYPIVIVHNTLTAPTSKYQKIQTTCFHCGEVCPDINNKIEDKHFCCDGCKAVYQILNDNGLCGYYDIDESKGISPKLAPSDDRFAYLDDASTIRSLISFENETEIHVTFSLPQIHCSSCVWLLEHLYKLNPAVKKSETNFLRKQLFIIFDKQQTSLRKIVELLATIGYEPHLQLSDTKEKKYNSPNRKRIHRLTVAGFCFGNIMLLSFPEYLSDYRRDVEMTELFGYLNLLLSLPVLLYSGSEFFISAYQGLRARFLNIDLPLSLSLLITFGRSLYEIYTHTGPGYFDSMAGIIFFMLIGRYFQDKKHVSLQFDRDFRSFFPISVRIAIGNTVETIPLSQLKVKNRIIIRSTELIPADSILIEGDARIDYSFVTGEARPEHVKAGELIYAGGRQTAGEIKLEVIHEVEQSYLTRLWNRENTKSYKGSMDNMVHKLARHFTLFLLLLSLASFLYWAPSDMNRGIHALTTILIVACPCALLLSATFTHASVISVLGKNGVFIKSANMLEKISSIRHIIWDKTGTLTNVKNQKIEYQGQELNETELHSILALVNQSNHPISRSIHEYLQPKVQTKISKTINFFQEKIGEGITGEIDTHHFAIGKASFVGLPLRIKEKQSRTYLSIDKHIIGYFSLSNEIREGLVENIQTLQSKGYQFTILSGDNADQRDQFETYFGPHTPMFFGQSPHDKTNKINSYQASGEQVIMVGDGLNDAGALMESNVGIAISDDVNNFTPACDMIMEGKSFSQFAKILEYISSTKRIIIASFILSLLYNIVGLSIAVRGEMSPLVAAILMPLSSISIILFTTTVSRIKAKTIGLRASL
jgi:Cu+-exporting ATPase